MPLVSDIFQNPITVSIPLRHRSTPNSSWSPPSSGSIKIYVDGSFSVKASRSGIGKIFRDHLGNTLLHFNKEITVDLVILIEIFAIREGLLLAAASPWAFSTIFLLESNNSNAVVCFNQINKRLGSSLISLEKVFKFSADTSLGPSPMHFRQSGNEATNIFARIGAHASSFVELV